MTIQTAIEKSIEGGWKYANINKRTLKVNGDFVTWEGKGTFDQRIIQVFILIPSFWQALGKSMGWAKDLTESGKPSQIGYLMYWHDLIDHLAEGGSTESYFEKL